MPFKNRQFKCSKVVFKLKFSIHNVLSNLSTKIDNSIPGIHVEQLPSRNDLCFVKGFTQLRALLSPAFALYAITCFITQFRQLFGLRIKVKKIIKLVKF